MLPARSVAMTRTCWNSSSLGPKLVPKRRSSRKDSNLASGKPGPSFPTIGTGERFSVSSADRTRVFVPLDSQLAPMMTITRTAVDLSALTAQAQVERAKILARAESQVGKQLSTWRKLAGSRTVGWEAGEYLAK